MKEQIYTQEVTVTLEGVNVKLHLLLTDGDFSIDYRFYDNQEEFLKSLLLFMGAALYKKCTKLMNFDVKPYIYEIVTDKFSVQRIQLAPEFSHEACFLLNSFEKLSFNDLIIFLKDYCKSDCSQDFDCISFIPSVDSQVKVFQTHSFGFLFSKEFVLNSSVEKLKEHFLATKLVGFMRL